MKALKGSRGGAGWGAGKLLADFERRLRDAAQVPQAPGAAKPPRPVET